MDYKRGWNNEPVTRKNSYTQEVYAKKKTSLCRIAKVCYYLEELMSISGRNFLIAFILFIVMLLGTSALPHVMEINISFEPETFWCRGGIFLKITIVFLTILIVSGIGYFASYQLVNAKCVYLDGGLEGTMEVDNADQRANLKGKIARNIDGAHVDSKVLDGPLVILSRYCMQNDVHIIDPRFFKWINRGLIAAQFILAGICVYILIGY